MADEKIVEKLTMRCAEENRRAELLVEWTKKDGVRRLTGVQCDNPRLQSLDNWQCGWSCWEKVKTMVGGDSDE